MPPESVTRLLQEIGAGKPDAFHQLLPLVYDQLHALAHRNLRYNRESQTLNTTALVHEAYFKLVQNADQVAWQDRVHFLGVAARAMRQVLYNYAVRKQTAKRGGGQAALSLDDVPEVMTQARAEELIALDEALNLLEQVSPRQCRIIECRYFAGLTVEETATALDLSMATVSRDWRVARAWLFQTLKQP